MIERITTLVFIVIAAHSALAEERRIEQGEAEVTADKLRVDHKRRTAQFEGNVRATFKKLTLTCRKMSLHYDDAGEVKSLVASGSVTVIQADVRATASAVKLDSKSGRLVLTGDPVLTKGTHRLTGKRIEVDLASGRAEVQAARGRFRLSKGGN